MKLNITIDGKTYEVDVEVAEPETPGAPRSVSGLNLNLGPALPHVPEAAPVSDDKVCRSPVSGIVVRVAAQVGQMLQPGDILLVLEAMKMETNITAPSAGKIAAIRVNPGDSVQAGQVVVEFES
jgi:methylmalonyl-CoA carboxyltransferase small subunit